MKQAVGYSKKRQPERWAELPNGELILNKINHVLKEWSTKFFGYHLLKVGGLSGEVDCSGSPIKHQVTIGSHALHSNVISNIDDLPCIEHSVDVCVLSHLLEFSDDPHHIVREANRILIPNGYLVITGYNPYSLAGLNRYIPYRRNQLPWNERFYSAMRIKDWLHLMGYEILTEQFSLHSSLANTKTERRISSYWRDFAHKFTPNLGSIYIIIAKKRMTPLTPIKPKWKAKPKFTAVNVSSMSSSQQKMSPEIMSRSSSKVKLTSEK